MPGASLQPFLDELKSQHRYRQRMVVQSPQATELTIDGKSYLNFCSNDYLGHANHPKVIEAFITGVKLYGVGSGASHLINGHSEAHHKLEEELAAFVHRPRALLFSTGYMANLGVISALLQQGDHVFEDRLNHASLLDGGLLSQARLQRYQHADVSDLTSRLEQSKAARRLVATDGVFSMDGDVAPLDKMAITTKAFDAWLMVDDAHGLGVVGDNGRGLLELFKLGVDEVPILVGTLGKAMGTFGAFVAGSEELIETLIQKARSYIYTTALPPAIAEATRASLKLVDEESWRRQKLQENISYFKQSCQQTGLDVLQSSSAIQPVIIGGVEKTVNISNQLKQDGLLISAIRPPTVPEGTARLRITLCAEHTHAQMDMLVEKLNVHVNR
jgi:8-amino-7-oxononanoate synthase